MFVHNSAGLTFLISRAYVHQGALEWCARRKIGKFHGADLRWRVCTGSLPTSTKKVIGGMVRRYHNNNDLLPDAKLAKKEGYIVKVEVSGNVEISSSLETRVRQRSLHLLVCPTLTMSECNQRKSVKQNVGRKFASGDFSEGKKLTS